MSPTVSVILPVFNRPEALRVAMRSVLDQSYTDLELIIADDCSTVDIKSVVADFNDPRVRYVRRETNGGAAAARNTGFEQAQGKYIAFQDSDDLWLPGKLARQIELLEAQSPEVGGVIGAKVLYGRDNAHNYGVGKVAYAPAAGNWMTLEEDQLQRSLLENRISLQNAVFRRDSLPAEPLFDSKTRANVDWAFTVRLTQKTKILEDPDPVVFSYITPGDAKMGGSVSQDSRLKLMGVLRILRNNRDVYERYPDEHARMLYRVGSLLIDAGRPRAARRALLQSIRMKPMNALRLVGKFGKGMLRRLKRAITLRNPSTA